MSLSPLTQAIVALAIARRADFDDAEVQVYVDLLSDLQPSLVARACVQLGRQSRKAFEAAMPTAGDIRGTVADLEAQDRAAERAAKLLPAPSDADPRTWVFCQTCQDQGQQLFRCPGTVGQDSGRDAHLPTASCGRAFHHTAHSFAAPCPCVDTNPVIARRRTNAGRVSAA